MRKGANSSRNATNECHASGSGVYLDNGKAPQQDKKQL
jgi:hypothetical protein